MSASDSPPEPEQQTVPSTSTTPSAASRSHVQRRGQRTTTREHLIRAGLDSVLENGWAGTSVDKVVNSVGVPKGSFYHYFSSKDDFGFALLDTYQAFFLRRLERCFGERPSGAAPTFTHQLAAFLSESAVGMRRYDWRRGCLVGTLGQEVAGLHDEFRIRLDASIEAWEIRLNASIRKAQASGEVRADLDARRLSRSFWSAWEGAVLRARLARSAAPLVFVVEDFDQLIHI